MAGRNSNGPDGNCNLKRGGVAATFTYTPLNDIAQATDALGRQTVYTYDASGNLTQVTRKDATGTVVSLTCFTRNSAGEITAKTESTTLTGCTGNTTTYTYDNAAKLTQIQLPNNVTTAYTYDNADRLTGVTNAKRHTTLSTYSYTLDPVGNRTQLVDPSGTIGYQYDKLDRLTQVTYPGSNVTSYAHDPVGNRQTMTVNGTPTSYSYDNADELTQVGSTAYGYDANGNQTSRGSDTFTYDPENRLTQATIGGQTSSSGYNGDGQRLSHTVGSTTTNYTWDVAAGLPEVLQDGTNTYVYGLGLISSTDGSGNQTYFLHDGLGSTVALTDGSGNVTATCAYDAFRAVLSQIGSASTLWQLTGERLDADNSLYLLPAPHHGQASG